MLLEQLAQLLIGERLAAIAGEDQRTGSTVQHPCFVGQAEGRLHHLQTDTSGGPTPPYCLVPRGETVSLPLSRR